MADPASATEPWPRSRTSCRRVEAELARLKPAGLVYAGTIHNGSGAFRGTGPDGGKPRPIHVLRRGDVKSPGAEVGPGTLERAGRAAGDLRPLRRPHRGRPPRGAGPLADRLAERPCLAVDRQPGLAVPFRPGDRRHPQRLRPDGPASHASRAARLAGGRVPRRRPVAQGPAPADRHVRDLPASVGRPTRRPRRSTRATPTSGG